MAEAQPTGYLSGSELIDRQGRKLIRGGPIRGDMSAYHNRVTLFAPVGQPHGRSAVIDTTGRMVRDWQPGSIHWAVPGYFFSESFGVNLMNQEQRRSRLLDPNGRVLLGGQWFSPSGP